MAADGAVDQECVEGYLFARSPLRVLLVRRPPRRGRIWVPVSGKVDPKDRDLASALRRELAEETGLDESRSPVPLDWSVRFEGPDGRRWRLHAFGVEVPSTFVPRLSREHDAFAWLAPERARERLYYSDNREALDRLLEVLRDQASTDSTSPVGRSSESPPQAVIVPRLGEALYAALREGHHRKIALQVPAGLVRNAHDLAATIREAVGVPVVVASRPCFGACDFPSPSETPGVDALVVLGHAPIPNVPLDRTTYFVEMREAGGDPDALAATVQAGGVPPRVGLVASVQHLDLVEPFVAALQKRGYTVRIGTGDRRLQYAAQALGCNYTTAEAVEHDVDAFLFLGTGRFHPLGLAFAVEKPVWSIDPLRGELDPPIDRGQLVRRRQLLVATTRGARRWGILVSTLAGQNRSPTALTLQARARARGFDAELFVSDRIDPRDLEGRDVDAYVNTACPRIALDDSDLYPRPVLTVPEFLMAIGEAPLEPYRFDTYH
ncbi:MAG: diphthamide biosynthesis enzyme Dph2 [Thermoplasmata archaeon]|nr:diphthamide biosynthesis enzyme Dph2 [Thermoplasmata archaeon]MCI4361616.1 diphthamide biosynthesis enzyme Dph2 [Thermoplasmata archaeon]